MDLSGKVCVITGASSGIGKSLSIKFASRGASVALAARRNSKLTSITDEIKQLGGNAIGIKTDITKSIECKNLIDETLAQYGRIDLLLLGAGVSMWTPFEKIYSRDTINYMKPDNRSYNDVQIDLSYRYPEIKNIFFYDDRLENLKTAHEMGWITFWIHPNYLLGNKYHYINMSFPNIIDCLKYLERKS